jgi:hypothetical protein
MDALERAVSFIDGSKNVTFSELLKTCERFFGNYRVNGSHHIFKTPWQGDPRINLQKGRGNKAKPYQVKQVLNALRRKLKELENANRNEENDKKTSK